MEAMMKRRTFLKSTAALAVPTIVPATVFGKGGKVAPSERAAIGIVGCGNRGRYAGMYKRYEKSQVVAVCDPVKQRRLKYKKTFDNCDDYNDFRELLDRKDINGIHVATADHWHVPIALYAAKAGKDMYIEKPLGISITHDLKAREIVDKYKRVFQYGAQQRSISHVRLGIELVLNGHIGDVNQIYVWAPQGLSGRSATPVLDVPEGFDYDMWLGPAPKVPFCHDRCLVSGPGHNGIFHIYDYAIGFIAGWGAHPMDMLQWWADNADMAEIPVKYEGTGTLPTKGLFNTVTNWDVHCTYANGLKMRFMDNKTAGSAKPHPGVTGGHGTLFIGPKGWVLVSRGGWKTSTEELRQKAKNPGDKRLKVSRDQVQNFVDCVLSRETPVDDLHSAVRSDVATHLSEISVRTGRAITWDPKTEQIKGDAEAAKLAKREMRKPWTL
jgi:predicted dehydrogenase